MKRDGSWLTIVRRFSLFGGSARSCKHPSCVDSEICPSRSAYRHLESGAVFLIGRENVLCCCVLIVGGPTLLCRVEHPNEISGWCVLVLTRLYSPNTAMSMGCQIGIPRVSKCIQHYSWPLLVVIVGIGQLGGLLRGGGRKKDSAPLNSTVVRKVRGNNVQTTRRNDQDSNKDVLNSTESSPCKTSFNIPHI